MHSRGSREDTERFLAVTIKAVKVESLLWTTNMVDNVYFHELPLFPHYFRFAGKCFVFFPHDWDGNDTLLILVSLVDCKNLTIITLFVVDFACF